MRGELTRMNRSIRALLVMILLLLPFMATGGEAQNFLFLGQGEIDRYDALLRRPDIDGVQIVYTWKQLEPKKGRYDFAAIEHDLARATALHKALFIQLQDRFFSKDARNLPGYLLSDPVYRGGLVAQLDNPGEGKPQTQGWAAQQWNRQLRERYQQLLQALAKTFDGRVQGINLPETAIDIDQKDDRTGFSCDAYFEAELENMLFARRAFTRSA